MRGKPSLHLKIAIAAIYAKRKQGKHDVENLGYVIHGIPWNPRWIHEIYRSWFAIESSYRMRNLVKPRTSRKSGDPIPLRHHLVSSQEPLDDSVLDTFFTRETRSLNHRDG